MRSLILPLVCVAFGSFVAVAACGGDTDGSAPAADSGPEAAPRYEASVPDTYVPYVRTSPLCVAAPYADAGVVTGPGFTTDDGGDDDAGSPLGPPQLIKGNGSVLAEPRIVPITFAGDDLADQIEDFAGSIGCTDWWRQTTAEYGIGQAQMLTPVRSTDPAPDNISDTEIRNYIAAQIKAKTPGFVNASSDVIYTLFYPASTTIELQGATSCSQTSASFGGYHDSFSNGGKQIAYAVVARCGGDGMDVVTSAATHELVEATTDPYPQTQSQNAYEWPDDAHIALAFAGGGEAGDLCEFNRDADYQPGDYPFIVQRTWSNASILAGHDPCVPAPAGPYAIGIPDAPDTLNVQNVPSGTTRGISIPVGGTRTIDIHFHSDDPKTTTWTITANDASRLLGDSSHLTLNLDTTTATVGQVAHLTITRNSQGQIYGVEPFTIRSSAGGNTSSYYGIVGD